MGLVMVSAKVEAKAAASFSPVIGCGSPGSEPRTPTAQEIKPAERAEPILVAQQPVAHHREAEARDDAEDHVGDRRPKPETMPKSAPSKKVRRTQSTPTGPAGTAITMPTKMPLMR